MKIILFQLTDVFLFKQQITKFTGENLFISTYFYIGEFQ